jgi:hypothetical protein
MNFAVPGSATAPGPGSSPDGSTMPLYDGGMQNTITCVAGCAADRHDEGPFRERLQNSPIPDVRRVFACSVTTPRTMGGPGRRRGPSRVSCDHRKGPPIAYSADWMSSVPRVRPP